MRTTENIIYASISDSSLNVNCYAKQLIADPACDNKIHALAQSQLQFSVFRLREYSLNVRSRGETKYELYYSVQTKSVELRHNLHDARAFNLWDWED